MIYKKILQIFLLFFSSLVCAQSYYLDKSGVIRETKSKKEVSFWGVNYTLPFAHAYRMCKRLGVDPKEAIEQDVYHFARLGFNAYRIHIWDVEISDRKGNLIENEHLDLLDYLICKLKERNIKIIYTPMAYWGNGYPEKSEKLSGFSSFWNKAEMSQSEEAIKAQENYLSQFVSHVNAYTGLKIQDDPDVVGFEINNEPVNPLDPSHTTAYVKRMVAAIRNKGCKKLVFYNVSHNFSNTQAFYDAGIDGGTFQWYPTGLVAGHSRKGNFLPTVDAYPIPFNNINGFSNKAKVVYEFDPADITDSYLYPAIARTFRKTGFQWVTQFAYDPTFMAWANTEYQTHYLNLVYTPQKAISMKIASEVMKEIPRNTDFGSYPTDTIFGHFKVSYDNKLSLLNSGEKFFYSNHTSAFPVNEELLREVAGFGNSSIITYPGTGAYFLDKLSDGVWRLEVMPDQVWIKDPFCKTSIKEKVASVLWNQWPMQIKLSDLGHDFGFWGLNEGNARTGISNNGTIQVSPGVYLLTRKGIKNNKWNANSKLGCIRLGEFAAPDANQKEFMVVHHPQEVVTSQKDYTVSVKVIGPEIPDSVFLLGYYEDFTFSIPMKTAGSYDFQTTIPAEKMKEGLLNYAIVVYKNQHSYTFPSCKEGDLRDWDFTGASMWSVRVEDTHKYITLYSGQFYDEAESFVIQGDKCKKEILWGEYPGILYTSVSAAFETSGGDLLLRHYVKPKLAGRKDKLELSKHLYVKLNEMVGIDSLSVGFITKDGFTYKKKIAAKKGIVVIPFVDLQLERTALLPQAYPAFLPAYFYPPKIEKAFDVNEVEFWEISTGIIRSPGCYKFEVESAWLQ